RPVSESALRGFHNRIQRFRLIPAFTYEFHFISASDTGAQNSQDAFCIHYGCSLAHADRGFILQRQPAQESCRSEMKSVWIRNCNMSGYHNIQPLTLLTASLPA